MSRRSTTSERRARTLDDIPVVTTQRIAATDPTASTDPLVERNRRIWSAGDYDRIAAGFRREAEAFVDRLALTPELTVLDAACGSGNLTIPAARAGARVTGFDLVPALLGEAFAWSLIDGLDIAFDQGTVEALPYPDASFDVVMSMFGVMFAARPDRVVAELTRVTRPGGRVALANWTPAGFTGRMLAIHVAHVPPPTGIPSPLQWGNPERIREWFDARDWTVKAAPRTLTFRYPGSPAETAELFRAAYGPTVRAMEALDADRASHLAAELAAHWTSHNRPRATGTEVDAEYLEVIAVRR